MIDTQIETTTRHAITTRNAITRYSNVPDVIVDDSLDALLTDFSKATLRDRYLTDIETPQDRFANCVRYYANDAEHAQRMYSYIARLWCMPATPILSNGGTIKGNLISCFLSEVEDSLEGIINSWVENSWLAAKGGGTGIYYGKVRSRGERAGVNGKTTGAMSFIKVNDSLTTCISQGSLRRGSSAIYMDINHPEIEYFVDMRMEAGGDPAFKAINLHHGVLITDAFYEAAIKDEDFELISPHDGKVVKKVKARALFEKILEMRMAKGEPYIVNIDTVNRSIPEHHKRSGLKVTTSNLCVAPETRILTREGYKIIAHCAGTQQEVWNGKQWSLAQVEQTGINQKLVEVHLSNGAVLNVTEYHKWKLQIGYGDWKSNTKMVETRELQIGDKLVKPNFTVVEGGEDVDLDYCYRSGFYTADGTMQSNGKAKRIYLYGEKRELLPYFASTSHKRISEYENDGKRHAIYYDDEDLSPKYSVPFGTSIASRLAWLAGFLDGDGTVTRNGTCETIQVCSIHQEFMEDLRLLLTTLGVDSKYSINREAGQYELPDGNGGLSLYNCADVYRMCITAGDTQRLLDLGLDLRRLKIEKRKTQRDAHQFVTVLKVVDNGRMSNTYCFNEPLEHMGVFEGVLTGNCSEITLPTGRDHHDRMRTAVCCLFQTNFETFDEWKDDPNFIKDIAYFMDNVLQDFIDNSGEKFINARYSAKQERSIGVGMMGFHSFLQKKMIPFESAMAKALNIKYFKHLRAGMDKASRELAEERGACPDAAEHGIMERFSCKLALAPTASVSIIAGTSPGGDPIAANYYQQKTLDGTFSVRNKYLEKLLDQYDRNTEDVWTSILDNLGSVAHLDFLTDHERNVFKTSFEINPRWYIEHAVDRTPYICQSQSLNLWVPPTINKRDLLMLHIEGWKRGIKSWYYLRSFSIQRADSTSGHERTIKSFAFSENTNYEECLACQ